MPEETRRLFPELDLASLDPLPNDSEKMRSWILGRLLEEGDTVDLCWLATWAEESELAAWFERRGGRRTSRRARAFWSLVLDTRPSPSAAIEKALWPL